MKNVYRVFNMKKVLIIRNDRFGEFLLNIPVFRAVKETWPLCELSVAVAPGVVDLAGAVPFIDKVMVLPSGKMRRLEQLRFIMRLRREKFSAAVVLNPTAPVHQMIFVAGIPVRVGYARKHAFLLTKVLPDVKGLGQKHEVESNLELAALLECSTRDTSLELKIPSAIEESISEKFGLVEGKPYIAVHPWTSDPVKQWPLDNFQQLMIALAQEQRARIVIIGHPELWHQPLNLPVTVAQNILDLRDKTTLLEAAAVLKRCAALVSCDSGPVHLAATVGTPVVALFRNDIPGKNPERWGPWGKNHQVIQKERLQDITVEDVALKVHNTALI